MVIADFNRKEETKYVIEPDRTWLGGVYLPATKPLSQGIPLIYTRKMGK